MQFRQKSIQWANENGGSHVFVKNRLVLSPHLSDCSFAGHLVRKIVIHFSFTHHFSPFWVFENPLFFFVKKKQRQIFGMSFGSESNGIWIRYSCESRTGWSFSNISGSFSLHSSRTNIATENRPLERYVLLEMADSIAILVYWRVNGPSMSCRFSWGKPFLVFYPPL